MAQLPKDSEPIAGGERTGKVWYQWFRDLWLLISRKIEYPVNVKMFGAKGDGTTVDQAPLALAVATVYASGGVLYWPEGTYVSNASIANLHDVRHRGPGVIKRGSKLFYPDPKSSQSNTLYVSASGSSSNDGITSSEPMTLARSAAVLLAYSDRGLPGKWTVEGAAGTYTEYFNLDSLIWCDYPVTLKGPSVGGHPNTPTMIIDLTASASETGVECAGKAWLIVQDVKVINATTGRGFATGSNGQLTLTNCHTDNCLRAIVNTHTGQVTARGGDYDGNGISESYGYSGYYNATHSIEGDTGTSDAPRFHHFAYGVFVSEGAQGHLDYTNITNCTIGLLLGRSSGACNTKQMLIHRNGVGVLAQAQWLNNGIDFGTGGDVNTVNVQSPGGAPEYDYRAVDYTSATPRVQTWSPAQSAHTGTTSKTAIWTLTDIIRPWMVSEAGGFLEIDAYFKGTLTDNFFIFSDINNGGADDVLTTVTAPTGTTDIWVKLLITFEAAAAQRGFMNLIVAPTHTGTDLVDEGTGAVDLKNTAGTVKLSVQLANSADSMTPMFARCITTLGG